VIVFQISPCRDRFGLGDIEFVAEIRLRRLTKECIPVGMAGYGPGWRRWDDFDINGREIRTPAGMHCVKQCYDSVPILPKLAYLALEVKGCGGGNVGSESEQVLEYVRCAEQIG